MKRCRKRPILVVIWCSLNGSRQSPSAFGLPVAKFLFPVPMENIPVRVSVTSSIEQLGPSARDSIRTLLSSALARFNSRIEQVSVLVIDENGPRGGVDKICRVAVRMLGLGTVVTTARHGKFMAAVSEAAGRARRIVITKLKRPHSLRLRRRTKCRPDNEVATAASG